MFVKSDSELQKEYQDYFKEKMDKHGVDSPAAFGDEAAMKKFFDEVSSGWECGKGRKEVKTSSINFKAMVDSIVAQVTKTAMKEFDTIDDYSSYLNNGNIPLKEVKIAGFEFEIDGGSADTLYDMLTDKSDCFISFSIMNDDKAKKAKEEVGGISFKILYEPYKNSIIFNQIKKVR